MAPYLLHCCRCSQDCWAPCWTQQYNGKKPISGTELEQRDSLYFAHTNISTNNNHQMWLWSMFRTLTKYLYYRRRRENCSWNHHCIILRCVTAPQANRIFSPVKLVDSVWKLPLWSDKITILERVILESQFKALTPNMSSFQKATSLQSAKKFTHSLIFLSLRTDRFVFSNLQPSQVSCVSLFDWLYVATFQERFNYLTQAKDRKSPQY